jgi:hypothetical protein
VSLPTAFDILNFWFGPRPYPASQVQQHVRLWFGDSAAPELTPQTDELVRERFGELRPLARSKTGNPGRDAGLL